MAHQYDNNQFADLYDDILDFDLFKSKWRDEMDPESAAYKIKELLVGFESRESIDRVLGILSSKTNEEIVSIWGEPQLAKHLVTFCKRFNKAEHFNTHPREIAATYQALSPKVRTKLIDRWKQTGQESKDLEAEKIYELLSNVVVGNVEVMEIPEKVEEVVLEENPENNLEVDPVLDPIKEEVKVNEPEVNSLQEIYKDLDEYDIVLLGIWADLETLASYYHLSYLELLTLNKTAYQTEFKQIFDLDQLDAESVIFLPKGTEEATNQHYLSEGLDPAVEMKKERDAPISEIHVIAGSDEDGESTSQPQQASYASDIELFKALTPEQKIRYDWNTIYEQFKVENPGVSTTTLSQWVRKSLKKGWRKGMKPFNMMDVIITLDKETGRYVIEAYHFNMAWRAAKAAGLPANVNAVFYWKRKISGNKTAQRFNYASPDVWYNRQTYKDNPELSSIIETLYKATGNSTYYKLAKEERPPESHFTTLVRSAQIKCDLEVNGKLTPEALHAIQKKVHSDNVLQRQEELKRRKEKEAYEAEDYPEYGSSEWDVTSSGTTYDVLRYFYKPTNSNATQRYPITYRKAVVKEFIASAYAGHDMDNYVGKLKENEFKVLPLNVRIYAIRSVSMGDYVGDSEEKLINDLIEYRLPHDNAKLKAKKALFYTEVRDELDDTTQKQRFNRLMNELGIINEKAINTVKEELASNDWDLDDSASLLWEEDFRAMSNDEKRRIIKAIGVDDYYVAEEDGRTILRIIGSFSTKADLKYFFNYLHSTGSDTYYDVLIDRITKKQRTEYYQLLAAWWPNSADLTKYDTLYELIQSEDWGSDNFVTDHFIEHDFKNMEAKDKANNEAFGTFRIMVLKDLIADFTGDDDEAAMIKLFTHWPNDKTWKKESKQKLSDKLLNDDMAFLIEVHDNVHGAEYKSLRTALSGFFAGDAHFLRIIKNAIDNPSGNLNEPKMQNNDNVAKHLEIIAMYTPQSILGQLSVAYQVELVRIIESGLWTDGWDEETLLRLFDAVAEHDLETQQNFIKLLDEEVGLADVKDDFGGDNLITATQTLNTLDRKGSDDRIEAAIDAVHSYFEWFDLDAIIGELTDYDLRDKRITLSIRKKFILGIVGDAWYKSMLTRVGNWDEGSINRILLTTPPDQAPGMIAWLSAKEGEMWQHLEGVVGGEEYKDLHNNITEVSKVDWFKGNETGLGVGDDHISPFDPEQTKNVSTQDYNTIRNRQNDVYAIKEQGLGHPNVVPFADAGWLAKAFLAKSNVDYNVSFTKDDKINIVYDLDFQSIASNIRMALDPDVADADLSGNKTFEPSQMIGVYFLYDDSDVGATSGEIRIMSAFNLFQLQHKQADREFWETVDLILLLVAVGELKAAVTAVQKIVAIVDIVLSSATIIGTGFKDELPKEVNEAIMAANFIFGGYMLFKLGKAGLTKGRNAINKLRGAKAGGLTVEQQKMVDALLEGYEEQMAFARQMDEASLDELKALRDEIRANVELPASARMEWDNLLTSKIDEVENSLAKVADELAQSSAPKSKYTIDGVEVDEAGMLINLKNPAFVQRVKNGEVALQLDNASNKVLKAVEDAGLNKLPDGLGATRAIDDGNGGTIWLKEENGKYFKRTDPNAKWDEVSKAEFDGVKAGKTVKSESVIDEDLSSFHNHPDVLEARKIVENSNVQAKFPKLSIDDLTAIYYYTTEAYADLNKALRGFAPMTDNLKAFNAALHKALNKLPQWSEPTYRGAVLNDSVLAKYKNAFDKGGEIVEDAFMSTSKKPDIALTFADDVIESGKTKVVFQVKGKSGVDIENISAYGPSFNVIESEAEILFKSGAEFKVTEYVEKSFANGEKYVEIRLIEM